MELRKVNKTKIEQVFAELEESGYIERVLKLTGMGVRRAKNSKYPVQTLHEFVLGRQPSQPQVIVDEPCMMGTKYIIVEDGYAYSNAIMGTFLKSVSDDTVLIFPVDPNQIIPTNTNCIMSLLDMVGRFDYKDVLTVPVTEKI